MSLDLGRVYNRQIELQSIANSAALAAADELDGTREGVDRAVTRARVVATRMRYNYNVEVNWSNSALRFAPSADGDWEDDGFARSNPNGMRFVRVDTSALDSSHASVSTFFIQAVGRSGTTTDVSARAIAGPSALNVVPFAICAMSPDAAEPRNNPGSSTPPTTPPNVELVEYGFRRGVSYDLMQLNPYEDKAANFMVSPVSHGGTAYLDEDKVGAFICTGTMARTQITGESVTVAQPFPLASLFDHFNSRFDHYPSGTCDPSSAPPDANVKRYDHSVTGGVPWMKVAPQFQGAETLKEAKRLWTIANPLPAPVTNKAESYGVLWAYAKAVPFSSYTGGREPTSGYTPFGTSAWSTLYDPGRPAISSYPTSNITPTPYSATSGNTYFLAPTLARRPGVRNRRVLNVPLLSCPVSGSTATVLAIGRFFMTVPATEDTLYGEFAGIAREDSLGTLVELYP